jgi:ComF family protein
MLKSIKDFLSKILNSIFPKRKDYERVSLLTKQEIESLPKSPAVEKIEWIYPLFEYKNNTVKAIVWELKYRENTFPLEHIGQIFYDLIMAQMSDILLFDNDARFALIPTPISPNTRSERGFNQSELIAKEILPYDIERKILYAPQWLEKIKETPKQSKSLSREDRFENLRGCFMADRKINDYYVFLIDDVVTTGSTLTEARKTLLEAGAKEVFAFTIAH